MNEKEIEWLKEVYKYYHFYLINNELYMNVYEEDGLGLIFRPFNQVICHDHFDLKFEQGDYNLVSCEAVGDSILKLPRNFNLVHDCICSLRNKSI